MAIITSYKGYKKEFNPSRQFRFLEDFIEFRLKYLSETRRDTNYYTNKEGKELIINPIDHYPQLKEYEVWMQGYAATGESSKAHLVGKVEARNFAQACHILMCKQFLERAEEYNKPDNTGYIDAGRWDYNPNDLSYWGLKLYWNEELARKSFG